MQYHRIDRPVEKGASLPLPVIKNKGTQSKRRIEKMTKKKCFECKKIKPICEFNSHEETKDKLSVYCISCETSIDNSLNECRTKMLNDIQEWESSLKKRIDDNSKRIDKEIRKLITSAFDEGFNFKENQEKGLTGKNIFKAEIFNKDLSPDKCKMFVDIIELFSTKNILAYDNILRLLNHECKIKLTPTRAPYLFALLQILNNRDIIKSHKNFQNNKKYLEQVKQIFDCYSIDTLENKFTDYVTKPKNNKVNEAENYFNFLIQGINQNMK